LIKSGEYFVEESLIFQVDDLTLTSSDSGHNLNAADFFLLPNHFLSLFPEDSSDPNIRKVVIKGRLEKPLLQVFAC
jgi:hypothetical protein